MRTALTIALLFSFSFLIAQFDWVELPPHNVEHTKVIYRTDDERLIGIREMDKALLASDDFGSSWHLIASLEEIQWFSSDYRGRIAENSNGTLFISGDDYIYEVDENNTSLSPYLETNFFLDRGQFFFTDNDDLIFVNFFCIERYDSSGQLVARVELTEGDFDPILVKGNNDIHCLLYTSPSPRDRG